ncbi:MAG: hypothetical protein AABO41_20465 [Acidobacteriota bacterium]
MLEHVSERLPVGWKLAGSNVVDSLYSIMAPWAPGKSNIRRFNLLYKGIERLARTMDLDQLLYEFEIDLHSYVAAATKRRMFLHAGAVGWNGRAIVLPGKNFSGRTSLVTAFLRAGAAYYSDEFAVLDSHGRVHPYPWERQSRPGEGERPRQRPIEAQRARTGNKPLPIGFVLLSEYRQGAKWRPRSLSQGQAALAMLGNVRSLNQSPEVMLRMLGQAVSGATVLKGVRGEADEMVESILKLL